MRRIAFCPLPQADRVSIYEKRCNFLCRQSSYSIYCKRAMRNPLTYSLTRLLPAALAFPVALAAAPLCTDCPTVKTSAVEKSAHACCDKTPKLTQSQSPAECASCFTQAAAHSPSQELKTDLDFVAIRLPVLQVASLFRNDPSLAQHLSYHPPAPPGAAFIIQLKILV